VDESFCGRIIAINFLDFGSVFHQSQFEHDQARFCLKAAMAARIVVSLSQSSLARFTASDSYSLLRFLLIERENCWNAFAHWLKDNSCMII